MSIESQAALLLSLSASLPSKSQSIVATPLSQIRTRESLIPAHYGSNELNSSRGAHSLHDALLYVGVTLERPANGSWGLTMFRISQYLVVGGVQQNVMCTSWAWATTTPPKSGGDFRTSFGPLYPTSLLQLVPGDVILSINGQSEFDPSIWHAPRLDILAVRLESARRAAHDVLCLVNVEYRAAEVAFQTMEPMLSRVTLPKACQRQLFPVSHNVSVRKVSEESSLASSQDTSQVTQSLSTTTSFPEWLAERKVSWREMRRQKRKLTEVGEADRWGSDQSKQMRVDKPQENVMKAVPSNDAYREPLVFLCIKLVRPDLTTPWGIHVSHHDRRFLGVGYVNDAAPVRKIWAWATTSPMSGLLNVTDEQVIYSLFERQRLHSNSPNCIQSGDFILSVSGRPISSFASLSDIANHMKQTTSMVIVVVRHRVSTEIAQRTLREGKPATDVTNVAFHYLLPILYHSPSAMALLFPQRAPVPRKPPPPVEDFEDGKRSAVFLPTITSESFPSWLKERKASWRGPWNIRPADSDGEWNDGDDSPSTVARDFWARQGYSSFNEWLTASTFRWKQSYSWNRKRLAKLAKACDEVVHFPLHAGTRGNAAVKEARHWLRVRKQQWRILRRKRQRRLEEQARASLSGTIVSETNDVGNESRSDKTIVENDASAEAPNADCVSYVPLPSPRSAAVPRQTSGEMSIIDALLEEEEQQQRALQGRPPLDITFLFDATLGAPDDVVVHCLEFLPRSEHAKLLCVSSATSAAMKNRNEVWRQLCPSHWVLPRRPRKRWHEYYTTKIYEEEMVSRKWADDFLNKASDILFKQDNLNQIEKLVKQGEKRVDFDINYISGVVCERNSLLNLAAIYSRIKVVRWLVETKGADIETYDRGGFTPLLNAAWAGDRQLVRFLLSHGADRTKIGLFHYFEGVNRPEFRGLNAEGWARKKGHDQLADLIRLGL